MQARYALTEGLRLLVFKQVGKQSVREASP